MKREYTWPTQLGIDYPKSPKNNCGRCCNGHITSLRAIIPGYACSVITFIAKEKGIDNINPQVDEKWGTCKFFNIPLKSIKDAKDILLK